MTNIFGSPKKMERKAFLFEAAVKALEENGWKVERIPRAGKSSVRRITKGNVTKTVSIRTSQDTWIAFPRNTADDGWATLSDVDYVVAATVDDRDNPRFAQVHMIDGDEMRRRFDRAYAARKEAGHALHEGRGIWISLYDRETSQPVAFAGAGAGLDHPPIARVPLTDEKVVRTAVQAAEPEADLPMVEADEPPLTIAEAKRRLALSLGVNEADIKIIING